ncbi:MAG: M20 family metallopeptidase [Clostridiales bacterium]|nr:M20 family metallopeptidase [Clostridiales bacterium]
MNGERTTNDTLRQEAEALSGKMRDLYRIIHQNPELGRQEHATSVLVERRLLAMGLETERVADTGIVGLLRGGRPGKTVAIRAELDALPIREESGLPWASQNEGVMHACGHDFHTAALLGTAQLLASHREELPGNVKFFFQPNEEGDGGAELMIRDGCMEQPHVDAVFGLHCDSQLPAGEISVMEGRICAASNPFTVILRGRGAHGAKPHEGDDVIVAGAQIVTAIQTLVSRRTAPTEPVVISVGTFHSGVAGNVLDTEARLTGIIRTLGSDRRREITGQFREMVETIAHAMGCQAEVVIEESYPGVRNDAAMTRLVRRSAAGQLGAENVHVGTEPSMGTDDFGYFSHLAPGCYFQLGTADPSWPERWRSHTPQFRVSEQALPIAAALHARIAVDYLTEHENSSNA